MHFEENEICHLFNRSNRGQLIFYKDDNYQYFLKKVTKEWVNYFDILAYCLMPTHFHFMVHVKEIDNLNKIKNAVGKLLSSYTQALNKQNHTHGSLFQDNTKTNTLSHKKVLHNHIINANEYPLHCFNYIHLNQVKDKFIINPADWKYSSYLDYAKLRENSICNISMAEKMLGFTRGQEFIAITNKAQNDNHYLIDF